MQGTWLLNTTSEKEMQCPNIKHKVLEAENSQKYMFEHKHRESEDVCRQLMKNKNAKLQNTMTTLLRPLAVAGVT